MIKSCLGQFWQPREWEPLAYDFPANSRQLPFQIKILFTTKLVCFFNAAPSACWSNFDLSGKLVPGNFLATQAAFSIKAGDNMIENNQAFGKAGGRLKNRQAGVPHSPVKLTHMVFAALTLCTSTAVLAGGDTVLVTGRRDPRIFAIDMNAALRSENNGTDKAIISRSLVNPRRLDGKLLGDPANIKLSADQKTAFVMNHHGAVVNAEFLQHGGRGSISVMSVGKMVNRRYDNTSEALKSVYDLGWFGGVGLIVLPNLIIGAAGEGWLSETGSNRISIIDRKTGGLRGQIEMELTGQFSRQLSQGCAAFPVPFVSVPGEAATAAPINPTLAPDPHDGCWPDPEGIALGHGSDGKTYLFSGNADTEDISIMDFGAALAGAKVVEVAKRVPIQTGPFTINASPNGKYIAATGRESHVIDFEGNTLSIIDVDLARLGRPNAEAARVLVGADSLSVQTRPFTATWTPDGRRILVTNYRTNSLSVVDLKLALAHDPKAEIARIPLTRPDKADARPKGVAVTADGQYALVAGGPNTITTSATALTGMLHVVDIQHFYQVSTVANVGIDPYGVAVVERRDRREDEHEEE